MLQKNYYDIIIVGSGIAGLYSAYNILKMKPRIKLLILEADKKSWFGGRTGNVDFYGSSVPKGAGVGRKNKDYLLIDLLKELNVHYSEFIEDKYYSRTIHPTCQVKSIISYLQKTLKREKAIDKNGKHLTFKQFALPILGNENYEHFLICAAFRDFEKEDAYDVLLRYGFDDNYGKDVCLSIPWSKLTHKLAQKISFKNIAFSSKVTAIHSYDGLFQIDCINGNTYISEKTIIATTIKSLVELLPQFPIYKQIHGYNFLRVYGKFNAASISIMKKYVPGFMIVPGPLQKILRIDPDKGVYMIAYSDNDCATYFKERNLLENNEKNREIFCKMIAKSLGFTEEDTKILHLNAIKHFYWSIGTHYCQPLNTNEYKNRTQFLKIAQHPMNNMLVVGEVVSNDQGWTEGALDSVHKVLNLAWLTSH